MKSLIYQNLTPFNVPADCAALPCRTEVTLKLKKFGRLYNFVLRDRVLPEDSMLVMVKAALFALRYSEPYNGRPPDRAVKDFMIKDSVLI
jgi:hypothetical protein